jgi:hypothetical protein
MGSATLNPLNKQKEQITLSRFLALVVIRSLFLIIYKKEKTRYIVYYWNSS